ncbi:T7SS effector LXG polymorphic toxin [Paraliobacillus sp. JSM ZJ581]|uniref:T7SS effector LXG polymorphic toxin n=1 Tax=Paraliobacillus sp. JSM ZJ581 TaxID=3342118 RepID=UPI0035A856F4
MGKRVNLEEVVDFQDEWNTHVTEIKNSLTEIETDIEKICHLNSFSGVTADQAKGYFNDLHLTVLTTFAGLLTDLSDQVKHNITSFQAKVDGNKRAIVKHNYLQDIKEEIKEEYTALRECHNEFIDIVRSVSDITHANLSSFSTIRNNKQTLIAHNSNVQDDLDAFTYTGRSKTTNIDHILNEVKVTLNRTSELNGNTRFTDYRQNSISSGLSALKKYNQTLGVSEQMDEDSIEYLSLNAIEKANNTAIKDMDETVKGILNNALTDLKNGKINRETYYQIYKTMLKSKEVLTEEELKKEVPAGVLSYLFENKVKLGIDVLFNSNNAAIKYLGQSTIDLGKTTDELATSIKNIGGLFSKLSSRVGGAVVNIGKYTAKKAAFITKVGKTVMGTSKVLGGTFTAVSAIAGYHEDIHVKGKTVGEAVMHNGTSVVVGMAGGAIGGVIGTTLAISNPIGWAAVGTLAVGTGLTWAFNWAYDKNFLGLQDGLDAVGQKVDNFGESIVDTAKNVGEAISNGLEEMNLMNWGW